MKGRFFLVDDIQRVQIAGLQQALVDGDAHTTNELEVLRRRSIQQGIQLEEVSTMVNILARMLIESSSIDPKVLAYRVEAELEERRAPVPVPTTAATCVLCGANRTSADVEVTPYGAVCEPSCP